MAIKAQVLVGGRGKAGGIRLAQGAAEARAQASAILDLSIHGLPVTRLLIEEAVEVQREIYLGLVVDRAAGRVAIMASGQGGVEIEAVARTQPEAIATLHIDPFLGLRDYQARYIASFLALPEALWPSFNRIAQGLYSALHENDACWPRSLVVTAGGDLLALDAKINLDDNGLYRHPDLAALRNPDEDRRPRRARGRPQLVSLDSDIGCIVNGAAPWPP